MYYGLPENGELLIYTQTTNYDCGPGQITDSDIQISTGIYFLARKFQAQLSKMSSSRVLQKRSTLTKLRFVTLMVQKTMGRKRMLKKKQPSDLSWHVL